MGYRATSGNRGHSSGDTGHLQVTGATTTRMQGTLRLQGPQQWGYRAPSGNRGHSNEDTGHPEVTGAAAVGMQGNLR